MLELAGVLLRIQCVQNKYLTRMKIGTVITAKRTIGSLRPTRFISKIVGEASNKVANWYHCIALIVRVLF